MEYKGYTITAEVEGYDFYTIDENGDPMEFVESGNGGDVTGYQYENEETGDSWFDTMSRDDMEGHRSAIDNRLEELAQGTAI